MTPLDAPFVRRLWQAWSADTSVTPDRWTDTNRALGQCAVTALIVQDTYGGDLLRGTVNGESHYWNRLPDGREVDLTVSQFGGAKPTGSEVRPREYLLSNADTAARYALLSSRLLGGAR